MVHVFMLAASLAVAGPAQAAPAEGQAGHEKTEDAARTVPGGAGKGVRACHADIERWCKKVKPGEGRLGACLQARSAKLSKRCRRWASHGGKSQIDEALLRDLDGKAPEKAPEKEPEADPAKK